MQVIGFAIRAAQAASIQLGMLSRPMALRILVFNRRFSTSSTLIMMRFGTACGGVQFDEGSRFGRSVEMLRKKEFSFFASAARSPSDSEFASDCRDWEASGLVWPIKDLTVDHHLLGLVCLSCSTLFL